MSADSEQADSVAAKVAAILATSGREPGINEMIHLMKMTEAARQLGQVVLGEDQPLFTTQSSHLHA